MGAAAALVLTAAQGHAADAASLFDLSMDQLSQVELKSDITSIRAKPIEEQPGIVSVIPSQQIKETGARDLSDVLMLVPGFALDTDVESMVGLTFRGLQGQEGKVLLILDGIEVNEPLYGSLPILNHIPADAIEEVEIIRGPGPAMYGGSAALAVIRVTTKGASQNGGYGVVTPSYADGRWAENFTGGAGYTKNDWRFSFNGAYSDTFLSNQKYTTSAGTNIDLTHRSDMTPWLLDFGGGWRNLDLRLIYDSYHYDDSVDYGEGVSPANATRFDSLLASAKYDLKANDWLKILPQFTYRHQIPWYVDGPLGNYDITADRYQGDLNAVAELSDNSSLLVGGRFRRDEARASEVSYGAATGVSAATYYSGHPSVAYDDMAGFAQYDWDTRWVNLSIGGRYEYHDAVGGRFVPRLALTKGWKRFHLKALYSQASRIPGINVVQAATVPNLQAEQTSNYELEAGYKFDHGVSVVGNLFFMEVDKPIIYTAGAGNGGADEGYFNGSKISSAGFETELRWDQTQFSSYLSYSYYRAVDNDDEYLRGDADHFLAAPAHKITLKETWHILKSLDWNINAFWLGDRMTYTYPGGGISDLDSEFVLNTFINYRFRQFSFGLGVANLLDVNRYAPQPYDGGSGPLRLKGREIFAKLEYKF